MIDDGFGMQMHAWMRPWVEIYVIYRPGHVSHDGDEMCYSGLFWVRWVGIKAVSGPDMSKNTRWRVRVDESWHRWTRCWATWSLGHVWQIQRNPLFLEVSFDQLETNYEEDSLEKNSNFGKQRLFTIRAICHPMVIAFSAKFFCSRKNQALRFYPIIALVILKNLNGLDRGSGPHKNRSLISKSPD